MCCSESFIVNSVINNYSQCKWSEQTRNNKWRIAFYLTRQWVACSITKRTHRACECRATNTATQSFISLINSWIYSRFSSPISNSSLFARHIINDLLILLNSAFNNFVVLPSIETSGFGKRYKIAQQLQAAHSCCKSTQDAFIIFSEPSSLIPRMNFY